MYYDNIVVYFHDLQVNQDAEDVTRVCEGLQN